MASTTSREAALERRKALTNGGKKAESRFNSAPVRVRTAADARPTRTEPVAEPPASPAVASPAAVAAAPARGRASIAASSRPAPDLSSRSGESRRSPARAIPNPSRDLVLARREALSRRGKRADNSRDRTRSDVARQQPPATTVAAVAPPVEAKAAEPSRSLSSSAARSRSQAGRNGTSSSSAANAAADRRATAKRSAQYNPSRALVLARREALSKRGKSANTSTSTTAASVARQGNPDLTTRELAQKVRELKSKVGSAGTARNGGGCRPSGPNRNGARLAAAAEASWKVGLTETSQGQTVTGTQANRSLATTGNEAGTCRTVTGTEYLGAEIFNTFCQSAPLGTQPAKVRVSATSQGNRVTGNEVGRSEKVTGDEPGTCKLVTGTEYVSANQDGAFCGVSTPPAPRKVGQGLTAGGQAVSGIMVGRSELVTGNESGSGRQLSGDQYVSQQNQLPGKAPSKVSQLQTLRGTGVTGTSVGRSERVTGDEPGSCRLVTGDEYVGNQQYQAFCGITAPPEAAKVGFSVTNRNQVVSGTRTGRSELVTGDEPGTCKTVTGTPYAGLEQAGGWCSTEQVDNVRRRTPVRMGTVMTGIQPGIGGVMTGAERGACEVISGTQYIGADQTRAVCGAAQESDADFPQTLATEPWQEFSVQSPARVAQGERDRTGCVTGSTYEFGGRITGPFDMANDKVTGTEQFRFERRGPSVPRNALPAGAARGGAASLVAPSAPAPAPVANVDPSGRQTSRVTGAGQSSGLSISGDDWNRGKHVTGTEGASARRRNPTRPGPIAAMPAFQSKRNEELPEPVSRITGASGNTLAGSLITVSGGARG
jgi:hypothetical protein